MNKTLFMFSQKLLKTCEDNFFFLEKQFHIKLKKNIYFLSNFIFKKYV